MDDESDDESSESSSSEEAEDDIEFYCKFIKPLILHLHYPKDRAQAAAWTLKIIKDHRATEKVKTDYLKLMLMLLQHKRLGGIFMKDPDDFRLLEGFPNDLDLNEYARQILDSEILERRERIKRQCNGDIDWIPPYYTDYSVDLRQYLAVQEIPGFGVHCYYAMSKDPIEKWKNADKAIFHNVKTFTEGELPVKKSDKMCSCGEYQEECAAKPRRTLARRKRLKKWGLKPPTRPMGYSDPEERRRPSWGSNLLHVFDRTEPDTEEEEEEILALSKQFSELHTFLQDYEAGRVGSSNKTSVTMSKVVKLVEDGQETTFYREDSSSDDEESPFTGDLRDDAHLVAYFKGRVCGAAVQHRIAKRNQEVQTALPAKVMIPVTTPKGSPIPMRPPSQTVSTGCGTEVLSRSVSSYFNNDVETDMINKELALWVQRLQILERECAELAKQASQQCSFHSCYGE